MTDRRSDSVAILPRKARLGIVGGGLDSVIGETHLIASRIDGLCEVVAGAMSIDEEVAALSARAAFIPGERSYQYVAEMVEREAQHVEPLDAVIVATPPQTHAEIATQFLEAGFDVICEKPMTSTLEQARGLAASVVQSGRSFVLTHCYTGYPMVREARQIVRSGDLGRVQLVEAEFAGGDSGVALEPEDPELRHWRFKSGSMGRTAILGEVGSHAHNIAEFVTGQRVVEVSARLSTHAERREVYDNAYLDVSFDAGAIGRFWSSYIAAGVEHGLRFRIIGSTGSIEWNQEDPEVLWYRPLGGSTTRLSRGSDGLSSLSRQSARFRPGHPEGYALAFANLYSDYARGRLANGPVDHLPSVEDGISTIALIDAATTSHHNGGQRTAVSLDALIEEP